MPADGKPRTTDSQLLGTWVYGKKPTKYYIRQTRDGRMEFEGPHTVGGTVSGVLEPNGEWFQTELVTKEGEKVGKIRVRFVTEFGIVCSNFKTLKTNGANWGKDIFAHREELALADESAAAAEAEKKQEKPQKKKFSRVEVDQEEPLVLVGECNNWNIGEAKRKYVFSLVPEPANEGRVSHLRVEVGLEDFAFQIVSAKKGWDWRLYPPLQSKADLSMEIGDVTIRPAGEDGDRLAQGRNFHLRGLKGWSVEILVWVKDFQNMALCYTDPYDRKTKKWGKSGIMCFVKEEDWNKPPAFPKEPAVDLRSPSEYTFEEIEPLQLVGECCKWNAETEGLELTPVPRETEGERSHCLFFRMQARKVDFQIISRKAGFCWRLFPDNVGGQRIWAGKKMRLVSALGGESDGHSKNFFIEASFLSIVKLMVDLEEVESEGRTKLGKVHVGFTIVDSAVPQVGIAPKWIQFPPRNLCCFDEEFLAAAKTKEEQDDVLERRHRLVSELRWTLIEEYIDERVQAEVLALREHYPYHGRKSALALEFDEEVGRRKALVDGSAPTVAAATPAAATPAAATPAAATPAAAGPTAQEPAAATSTEARGDPLVVTVHISRELDVKTEIGVTVGTTVGELRRLLVELDPCGDTALEDVWFRAAFSDGGALADSVELWHGPLAELECCEAPTADQVAAQEAMEQQPAGVQAVAEVNASGEEQELTPLQAMQKDLELKLSLTRQRLEALATNLPEGKAEAGVTGALKEQFAKQARAFELALDAAKEAKSAEAAEEQTRKKWAAEKFDEIVFGTADAQWAHALQELPAVCSAQRKALRAHNLPVDAETVRKAVFHVAQRDLGDLDAAVATALLHQRLRYFATPVPETLRRMAEALNADRIFVGGPKDWFHGLDLMQHADWTLVRPDLEKLWKNGSFKQKFGGPKSGLFRVFSDEDLHTADCRALLAAAVTLKDQVSLLIKAMGVQGKNLRVEPRVLVSFHSQGEVLPSRVDSAGTARRLTLCLHYSNGHSRVADGGALKLSRIKGARKEIEVPAAGGHFCAFYTQEFKQAVDMVKLSSARWSMVACAEDIVVAEKQREEEGGDTAGKVVKTDAKGKMGCKAVVVEKKAPEGKDNFSRMAEICDVCQFSGGDGITLSCDYGHRVCRECLQKEIRMEIQPTCPACVAVDENDRVFVADRWDMFESSSVEEIGCICPRTGDFNVSIDPGSRVVLSGMTKESGLNGKLGEAIWWDMEHKCWDVRIFANSRLVKVAITSCNIADCCPAGGSLSRCPSWPSGRGVYPVSLGCRCCVKQGILECGDAGGGIAAGWPYMHGMVHLPFDWNLTSLEGVLFFLRHSFEHFFHFNNMRVVKAVNREDVKFDNFHSSMHAFIHHHPQKDGTRLRHRAERFKVLCRHTRDTRAARTLLFVRYMHDSRELARVDELYALLRLWAGAQIRLAVVVMKQTEKGKEELFRHARFPRVLIYLVGFVQVMEFAPFREVCKFSVYDEAGMLHVHQKLPEEIVLKPFRDPYTTKSDLCPDGDWLTDLKGEDPTFYPDCPAAQKQAGGGPLLSAVARGDEVAIARMLIAESMRASAGADPNLWDAKGRRPLHLVGEAEKRAKFPVSARTAVRIAGALLLAHADPRCHDVGRVSAVAYARQCGACAPLCALLSAAALEEAVDRGALFTALEMLDRLPCDRLARILDVGGLRAMGEPELTWRHPPPNSEAYIAELEDVIVGLERLPESQRKKEMKRLLLEWHPDKNSDRLDLATTVFQYLQAQKDRVVKR